MLDIKEGWSKYDNTDILVKSFEGLDGDQYSVTISGEGLNVYRAIGTKPGELGSHVFWVALVRSRQLERVWGEALRDYFNDAVAADVISQAFSYYIGHEWVGLEDAISLTAKEVAEDWIKKTKERTWAPEGWVKKMEIGE